MIAVPVKEELFADPPLLLAPRVEPPASDRSGHSAFQCPRLPQMRQVEFRFVVANSFFDCFQMTRS